MRVANLIGDRSRGRQTLDNNTPTEDSSIIEFPRLSPFGELPDARMQQQLSR